MATRLNIHAPPGPAGFESRQLNCISAFRDDDFDDHDDELDGWPDNGNLDAPEEDDEPFDPEPTEDEVWNDFQWDDDADDDDVPPPDELWSDADWE